MRFRLQKGWAIVRKISVEKEKSIGLHDTLSMGQSK